MKSKYNPSVRIALLAAITAPMAILHAADVTLYSGNYTDTQTYTNGTISGDVTFNTGANYTFSGNLTLPLAWNRITLNSGSSLNVAGNLSVDISGVSLNGGTFTAGGIYLEDSPNWAGTYNDGKLSPEQGDSIINGATVVASQSNANFISFITSPEYPNDVANNLWLGNDGATINSNGHDIGITMTLGNFSGQTGSLTKTGAGTLTLTENNTYTGGTTVNGGVLEIAGSNSGNGFIRGTVTVDSGAELRYTGGDGTGFGFNGGNKIDTLNINGGLVNSQGNMAHLFGATVNMTGGELRVNDGISSPTGYRLEWYQSTVNTAASADTATISGRVNLRGDGGNQFAALNVADGSAATDLLVSAAITESSGSAGITKTGAGTLSITGANTYTGGTAVNAGTLQFASGSLNSTAYVGLVNSTLQWASGNTDALDKIYIYNGTTGTLDTNGNDVTLGAILDNGYNHTGSLVKTGAGALTFTGTNTYTGTTQVNAGTLVVNGSTASASAVTIGGASSTGAPTVSGTGTIQGTLTISAAGGGAAGVVNPGAVGGIGTLHVANTSIAGTFACDINASTSDTLAVTGNLNLSGATLALNQIAAPAATSYTIASYSGTLTGTFGSPTLPSGYSINYGTGSNSTITLVSDYAAWGAPYGLTLGSEGGDLDGDGLTNFQEYAFGLLPNDGSSVDPVSIPLDKATGTFSYTRRDQAKTGISYKVFYSTDLSVWTEDTGASQSVTGTSGDVQTVQVTVSSALLSNPTLFIQVRAH